MDYEEIEKLWAPIEYKADNEWHGAKLTEELKKEILSTVNEFLNKIGVEESMEWEDITDGNGIGEEGLFCLIVDVEEDGTLWIDTDADD